MPAALGNSALIEHHDLIGIFDGGDAVGNEDGGALPHNLAQLGEDFFLGAGVDAGQGVV